MLHVKAFKYMFYIFCQFFFSFLFSLMRSLICGKYLCPVCAWIHSFVPIQTNLSPHKYHLSFIFCANGFEIWFFFLRSNNTVQINSVKIVVEGEVGPCVRWFSIRAWLISMQFFLSFREKYLILVNFYFGRWSTISLESICWATRRYFSTLSTRRLYY